MTNILRLLTIISFSFIASFSFAAQKTTQIFIASDSTATDYSSEPDYQEKRFPQVGWGQVFQPFFTPDSTKTLKFIPKGNKVLVQPRAKGGRSTRTFFEEGRWRDVVEHLNKGDLVLIQFAHNDQSKEKVDRYTPIEGYKEYLRLFIDQTRAKNARPVLITSVNRNYPWVDGKLQDCHLGYPQAMKEIAAEKNVDLIDLQQMSLDFFTSKGEAYVTEHYFMNLPAGKYTAYPNGQKDNTHFQPEGGQEVARLVFEGLQSLPAKAPK